MRVCVAVAAAAAAAQLPPAGEKAGWAGSRHWRGGGDRPRHSPTKCEWNQDGQIKVNIIKDRDGFDMK